MYSLYWQRLSRWTVQTFEDDESDFNKTEILVSEPKKVGDGMSAYIVYKVTTRVKMFYVVLLKNVFMKSSNLLWSSCIIQYLWK